MNDLTTLKYPVELGARIEQQDERRVKIRFPNGWAASVINDGYGKDRGLFELAVVDRNDNLNYDTLVTPDVEGYLTPADVLAHMAAIAALPPEVTA